MKRLAILLSAANAYAQALRVQAAQPQMRLLSRPVQPRWVPAVTITVSSRSVPEAWRDYLYWTGELSP